MWLMIALSSKLRPSEVFAALNNLRKVKGMINVSTSFLHVFPADTSRSLHGRQTANISRLNRCTCWYYPFPRCFRSVAVLLVLTKLFLQRTGN